MTTAARADRRHTGRHWTPERITTAFQEFYNVMGRTPTVDDVDWTSPSRRIRMSPRRIEEAERAARLGLRLPGRGLVAREFGSWSEGIAAAGLTLAPRTAARIHRTPHATQVCPSCGDFVSQIDAVHGWCLPCVRPREAMALQEAA
jgi:site-specific DNA-cytosine methylase